MDFAQAMRVLGSFDQHRVDYVLVGSMAMAVQGLVRATRDIDVFVADDKANVARLRAALRELFDDPAIDEIRSEDLQGDYPALQYSPPDDDFWIDIVARLGTAFRFADIESEELHVEGVRIRVATPRMLYRMKRDTVRPQDRLDAEALRRRFGLDED
jgi:Nucleotidyl transferase AbiEii toxin, Type IV TA system